MGADAQTHIQEQRSKTYEEVLAEQKAASTALQRRFDQLKEDFQYNLKLLEERDEELGRLDVTVSRPYALAPHSVVNVKQPGETAVHPLTSRYECCARRTRPDRLCVRNSVARTPVW